MFLKGNEFKQRMIIYDSPNLPFESDPQHSMKQRAAGSLYFYPSKINSCVQPDSNARYFMWKKNGCNDTEEQQKFTFGKNYAFQ